MMADFQNRLISRIFGVLSSGFFAQNNSNMIEELVREHMSRFKVPWEFREKSKPPV